MYMALLAVGEGVEKGQQKHKRRFSGCRRCNNTVNDDFNWDNYGMVIKQESEIEKEANFRNQIRLK